MARSRPHRRAERPAARFLKLEIKLFQQLCRWSLSSSMPPRTSQRRAALPQWCAFHCEGPAKMERYGQGPLRGRFFKRQSRPSTLGLRRTKENEFATTRSSSQRRQPVFHLGWSGFWTVHPRASFSCMSFQAPDPSGHRRREARRSDDRLHEGSLARCGLLKARHRQGLSSHVSGVHTASG